MDGRTATQRTLNKLSESQVLAYALPLVATNMLITPLAIIQGIYAKHYGIALSTLALIIVSSRIIDAVSDPIIGHYSDQYRKKYGTRKPFMVIGMVLLLLCSYFLYVPPEEITGTYAAVFFTGFYMTYTLFEIPHVTWPCDIASDPSEKTRLYSYRVGAGYLALVLFYCIPLLPFFPTDEITPQTLKVAFFIAAGLSLPFLTVCMFAVPSGAEPMPDATIPAANRLQSVRLLCFELLDNKPFLIFIAVFLCGTFSIGMWYGLIYIFVDSYLGMGEDFAKMFLIAFVVGFLASPLWYQFVLYFGKKRALLTAFILLLLSFLYTATLNSGDTSFFDLLLLKIIQTLALVGFGVAAPAMLADIIGYAHWKTGTERSATYFSLKVFLEKTASALGVGMALTVASMYGFESGESKISAESVYGLKIAMAGIPSVLVLLSLWLVQLIPIDERQHNIIKRSMGRAQTLSLEKKRSS